MTESLKKMLCNAKTEDEAFDILCAHGDELSQDDQIKMFKMVTGKTELSEEELEMVVGGNFFKNAWGSIKKAGSKAADSTVNWCTAHKRGLIFAACMIAGASLGVAALSGLVLVGAVEGTAAGVATAGTLLGGTVGVLPAAVATDKDD